MYPLPNFPQWQQLTSIVQYHNQEIDTTHCTYRFHVCMRVYVNVKDIDPFKAKKHLSLTRNYAFKKVVSLLSHFKSIFLIYAFCI